VKTNRSWSCSWSHEKRDLQSQSHTYDNQELRSQSCLIFTTAP